MSKYIKLEDAINKMDEWFCEPYTPTKLLSDLPTIEVSEDCISREWLINRFKDIVEHYDMRIRRAKRYGKKTTYDTSEQIGYWKDEIADYKFFIKEIEDAPSVVPTTEQSSKVGEWLLDGRCSNCLQAPHCGAKMKGAEE